MRGEDEGRERRHLIITCSDARYGDFLVEHWLRSLKANVCLDGIDVAVVDYGLNVSQQASLINEGVQLFKASPDGNITNIRYRDIALFLQKQAYDQVMAVDGGDLIFQADVGDLFHRDQASVRGVCEQRDVPFHDLLLPTTDMARQDYRQIFDFLEGKPTVNGGMILAPAKRFIDFWEEFRSRCDHLDVFGTDQLIMNYLVYRDGFVELDAKYNFVIMTTKSRFTIKDGQFYDHTNQLIPVVHNAGMRSVTRCIAKFGFGPGRNRRKRLVPLVLHAFFAMLNFGKRLVAVVPQRTSSSGLHSNSDGER